MIYPQTVFNVASIPSIQEGLLSLAVFVSGNITVDNVNTQQSVLQAIDQTLMNMVNLIDGYQLMFLMSQEYSLLSRVTQGPLPLSVTDLTLINNRLSSFNSFVESVYTLPTSLTFDLNNLYNGQPAVQDFDLTDYFVEFDLEIPPVGLSYLNFVDSSQAMATAWLDAVNYLNTNGTQFQSTSYDAVNRMYYCSQDTTNFVGNITFASNSANANLTQFWNSLVALPSLLRVGGLLYNDPSSLSSQLINTIKFVIINLILETNSLLASFNIPNNLERPLTATIRVNESLMDFAARTTGDYTQWQAIAKANDLMPPYVSMVPMPNLVSPGQKLFLPPFSVSSPVSNYSDAYLGTDIDFGPPDSELDIWTGDFSLIQGLGNYEGALARRILTPLGSLIYHNSYGSILPAEIGAITTSNEAILLASILKGAELDDPRTQSVPQVTAYQVNFGKIVMTSLVQPYGSNTPIPLNLVITPINTGSQA